MSNTAVGYVRVSTREQQSNGQSLEMQRERIQNYAAHAGLELKTIIVDAGESAGKPLSKRPGGAQVIDLLSRGEAEAVVALKLDRMFRSTVDALLTTLKWDKAGIALHIVSHGGQALDTSSPVGRLFLTMLAGFAEFERGMMGERTSDSKRSRRANGRSYAVARFGERNVDGRIVKASEETEVIEVIIQRRGKGESYGRIAEWRNQKQVPRKQGGERWYPSTVRNIYLRAVERARKELSVNAENLECGADRY